jgi:RNA polymerase sigma-70 factor (ECF subfamily)
MKNNIKITADNFTEVYNKYKPLVMKIVKMKMRNTEAFDEICNDVFLQVYKHIEKYDVSVAQFNTWLTFITKNKVIDYYRHDGMRTSRFVVLSRFETAENEVFDITNLYGTKTDASADVENAELSQSIVKAFVALKPKYRIMAEMFFMEQKQYDEISEELNVPMGTVKGTLARAKEMLQNSLKTEYAMCNN